MGFKVVIHMINRGMAKEDVTYYPFGPILKNRTKFLRALFLLRHRREI